MRRFGHEIRWSEVGVLIWLGGVLLLIGSLAVDDPLPCASAAVSLMVVGLFPGMIEPDRADPPPFHRRPPPKRELAGVRRLRLVSSRRKR